MANLIPAPLLHTLLIMSDPIYCHRLAARWYLLRSKGVTRWMSICTLDKLYPDAAHELRGPFASYDEAQANVS